VTKKRYIRSRSHISHLRSSSNNPKNITQPWLSRLHRPTALLHQTPWKPTYYPLWTLLLPPCNPSIHCDLFFSPFLTQNGHTPPRVAITPHIDNPHQFAVSSCLLFCFFYQRCSRALPSNPPCIHLVEYAWSAAATAQYTIGDRTHPYYPGEGTTSSMMATFQSPKNAPKSCMPYNWTKLRACLLKKGFVCLYLLVLYSCVFNCRYSCQLYLSAFYAVESSTSQMQTKQQSALKIGKKLEGVKTASWVEVSLYF
jgi:hypothetical protein